jgi:hypothetical protein
LELAVSIPGVEITVFVVAEVEQDGGLGMHKKAALRASFISSGISAEFLWNLVALC